MSPIQTPNFRPPAGSEQAAWRSGDGQRDNPEIEVERRLPGPGLPRRPTEKWWDYWMVASVLRLSVKIRKNL